MFNDDENNEIKELVSDYERSIENGIEPFLDVDDAIDIAQYYDDRGETDKARHVLEQGLEHHPAEPEIVSFLVRITIVAYNDIKKAEAYARTLNCDEHNIDYILAHSDILIAKGRFDEADTMVKNSLKNFTSEQKTDLLIEVAQMYVFAGEYEQALKWLKKSPEKSSRDYLEMMGDVLMGLNKSKESEAVFNKLLDIDAFCVDYWNSLAAAQMGQHKASEAKESVDYALAIDQNDFQARLNKAHILFYSSQTKQARKIMETLIDEYKHLPEDKRDNEFTASLLLNYCKVLLVDDDPRTAIEYLTILKDNAEIFDAHSFDITKQLAIAYISTMDYDKALKVVREVLSDPFIDNYSQFKILEGSLLLDSGEPVKASECFLDAIHQSETTLDTVFDVGVAYFDCGCYKNALDMLSTIVDECGSKKGLGYIAACHKRMGNKREFLSALKVACKECPEEVEEAFNLDIPLDVPPSGYYDYIIKHGDMPSTRTRRKK